MGQYFYIVNETKKEYICAHNVGSGLKLWEICANNVSRLLPFLLRRSDESGGGDIHKEYKNVGRWAGDSIVVVGDYCSSGLYEKAQKEYKEISTETLIKEFNNFIGDKSMELQSLVEWIGEDDF